MQRRVHNNYYIITGGPGSGKTTLIESLANKGLHVVQESAREIIQSQHSTAGNATQTGDLEAFCQLLLKKDLEHYLAQQAASGPVFFDRSLVDLGAFADVVEGEKWQATFQQVLSAIAHYRYNSTVFILPPWESIYHQDQERKHTFEQATTAYERLKRAYQQANYHLVECPKIDTDKRVEFLLANITQDL